MTFPQFRDLSINIKLTVIIIFSCLLVSLMASGFFIGREIISFRRSVVEDLSGLARVIGINCTAPLEFMDSETADEILSSLSARPHILQALLFTADGTKFSQYQKPSLSLENAQELRDHFKETKLQLLGEAHHFHKNHMALSVFVGKPGKTIGTLVLQADQSGFHAILTRLIYVVSGIFTTTLLLAALLSSLLNRVVSRPILELAETMERVRREKNYSIRAIKNSNDELGVLVKGINSTLDDIEKRDEQLLVAKKTAEDANLAKSQFLAQMSHEIRTPMNGILGIASLLLNTSINEKQYQFVHTIRRSGESLLNLINDILDFSKIEAGKLELELIQFDLREIAEETVDLLSERANEKNLNLACFIHSAVPAHFEGDPGRLRQILMNLLGNAIKFTNRGEVVLNIFLKKIEGNSAYLRFEVSDTGIGINKGKQKEIFCAFSQADGSTTRQFGGTGLGLAICHQLVSLMDGEIGVESVEGQGATFWFTTVFAISSFNESLSDRPHQPIALQKFDAVILVAEDNPTNQIVAQGLLEHLGCRIDLADNGKVAATITAKKNYDLIFMDCQMPVMDGYEATKQIRKAENLAGTGPTPIIALTAHAMKGDRERCLAVGMNDFITKPFNEQQLAIILSKWLPDTCIKNLPGPPTKILKNRATQSTQVHIDESVLNSFRQLQQPGKSDIRTELVSVYLRSSPGIMQSLQQAAEKNDSEKLWQAAHTLKSSSASLGARRLSSLCHELEIMGRETRVDDPLQRVLEIESEFKTVADELERILSGV
ncbi:MAG: response regulator [Proteobacteria bacterium]|nr:response regulator [Pseudomonadota bacterium]MBU1233160.1 response regulator [Pseudomonadota bacterium]MBU1417992.1 response regulator [Pseudomonadota bacterium]MBU1454528.1 response regulator [Pseudomonadota bacterium]